MTAVITELIEGPDMVEVVRDKIALILLEESEAQYELAQKAGKPPNEWKLRVFTERANAWAEYINSPDPDSDEARPIVNVAFRQDTFPEAKGNIVARQQAEARYEIDCYGYGVSTETDPGHDPGDAAASIVAMRTLRLVRRILMAGHYVVLGLRGVVGKRWPESRERYQPQLDQQVVQNVVAARLTLRVDFNEFSPQVQGEIIESIYATFRREGTGEVYYTAQYDKP